MTQETEIEVIFQNLCILVKQRNEEDKSVELITFLCVFKVEMHSSVMEMTIWFIFFD